MDKNDGTGVIFMNYFVILEIFKIYDFMRNIYFYFKAIVESQQLRRETETVGPSAELEYWRRLLARFSCIINHIKSPHTNSFIQLLTEIKSSLLKVFK